MADRHSPPYSLVILVAVMAWLAVARATPSRADGSDADAAWSEAAVSPHECGAGSLLFRTTAAGLFVPAPLLETDVAIDVTGVVARTVVRQRFHNPHELWLEGTYVFPLPDDAAVDAMRFVVGERVIEGEIQEREAARRTYERARTAGQRASLVEQQRPNLFTTRVANVGPDEVVDVVIEFQQQLRYDSGRFSLRFPMVVNPRYTPAGGAEPTGFGADAGDAWIDTSPRVHGAREADAAEAGSPDSQDAAGEAKLLNPVNLAVRLDLGLPITGVESASHPVLVTTHPDGGVRVEPKAGRVAADRDFVLSWRPQRGSQPRAALFRQQFDGETYVLLWVVPPDDDAAQRNRLPRETVFVLDRSGSMSGASIRQARQALLDALDRLPADDTFNLVAFNDSARRLFEQAVPAVEPHLTTARRYVKGLSAGGGTEMLGALRLAVAEGEAARPISEEGRVRQILFITDGSVSNEDQIFAYLHRQLGDRRLFTVGIGSAPNGHFMRRAAEFGRGAYVYISRPDEVAVRMGELFAKIETPVLSDLSVRFDDPAAEVFPERIGDLYLSEPLVVAARSASGLSSVEVEGWRGEVPWVRELSLDGGARGVGVHKLWARRKIEALETRGIETRDDPGLDLRTAIVEVALRHHLVSKHTSLVAVDETPARPEGEQVRTARLPLDTPAGWTPPGGILPRTGTSARSEIVLGLLLLTLAAWFGRRLVWRAVWARED